MKKRAVFALVTMGITSLIGLSSFTGESESGGGKKCFNKVTLSCGSIPATNYTPEISLGDRTFCQVTGDKTNEMCTEKDCFGQESSVACF